MEPIPSTPTAIKFGRFSVLPHRRELLAEGRPLELGGRAFDVLLALIEASGAVVSKDALMERVWPDRIIEENSLQHQISALRRVFGDDRDLIRTDPVPLWQTTGGRIKKVSGARPSLYSAGNRILDQSQSTKRVQRNLSLEFMSSRHANRISQHCALIPFLSAIQKAHDPVDNLDFA
jgi:hypothetical protein